MVLKTKIARVRNRWAKVVGLVAVWGPLSGAAAEPAPRSASSAEPAPRSASSAEPAPRSASSAESMPPGPSPVEHELWLSVSPAAKDCPSALELRERVAERLGNDPFRDDGAPGSSVQVSFTRVRDVYHARLTLRDSESNAARERQFEDRSENCRQLADAVVLGITLLLDGETTSTLAAASSPTVTAATRELRAAPQAPVDVTATLQTKEETESASLKGQDNRARVPSEIWVGPMLSRGAVSSDANGYGVGVLGVVLPLRQFGLAWGADYQAGNAIQRGQTRYEFSQTAAFVGPVWVFRVWRGVSLMTSAGLLVGVTHAAVITHDPTDPGDFVFVGGRFGAAARVRLIGPLALSLGGQFRTPFNRAVFRAQGLAEPVWKQPFLGAAVETALGLQFD